MSAKKRKMVVMIVAGILIILGNDYVRLTQSCWGLLKMEKYQKAQKVCDNAIKHGNHKDLYALYQFTRKNDKGARQVSREQLFFLHYANENNRGRYQEELDALEKQMGRERLMAEYNFMSEAYLNNFYRIARKDHRKSFLLRHKAAELGNIEAQYKIALAYREGIYYEHQIYKDNLRSYKWFYIITNYQGYSEGGYGNVLEELEKLALIMSEEEVMKSQKMAQKWIDKNHKYVANHIFSIEMEDNKMNE